MDKRGGGRIKIFRRKFFVPQCRYTSVFRKKSGIEKFQAKEGGGFTVLSSFCFSHRTEKTSPGNHSVFQKIAGMKKHFMDKGGGKGRGYQDLLRSFCHTVPKHFTGEHFGVSEKFFYRKFSSMGGWHHGFVEFFVSRDRNQKLCKGTTLFSGKFVISKKIYG